MKRILLFSFLLGALCTTRLQAQLVNAIIALENNEVKVAKSSIDKQMAKEKSATDPKSWYYNGLVHERIAGAQEADIQALATNAVQVAYESYSKAISLDKPKGEWKEKSLKGLENVWVFAVNGSIGKSQEQKFDEALALAKITIAIKSKDTLGYLLAYNFAVQSEKWEEAMNAYKSLIGMGIKKLEYYKAIYTLLKYNIKNEEEAFAFLTECRANYPNESVFMAEEVNYYIAKNKTDEAIAKMNEAIQKDPANSKVYYNNLGIIYNKLKNIEKARFNFNKALELDPNYADANFMMGFIYLDESDALSKILRDMTGKEYQAKGKQMEAKREELYKKAVPYFEKSYAVSPEEQVKNQLIELYKRLKMDDKIKALK